MKRLRGLSAGATRHGPRAYSGKEADLRGATHPTRAAEILDRLPIE